MFIKTNPTKLKQSILKKNQYRENNFMWIETFPLNDVHL